MSTRPWWLARLRALLDRAGAGGDSPPPVGSVNLGDLRRLDPISQVWGFDRGLPIDRYYIEQFLEREASHIKGHVLEIGDASYTRRFGGARVTVSDVLHVRSGTAGVTIVGDLTRADHIPSGTFDCIILTQTLQLIYEVGSAVRTIYRILKPGGVVLATVPGVTPISDVTWSRQWYWNFTSLSATKVFQEEFPESGVMVQTYGNVLSAVAFLHGLAAEELAPEELAHRDARYDVTIAIRARKPDREGAGAVGALAD